MKKISAWFLAFVMVISLFQVPAYAGEGSDQAESPAAENTEYATTAKSKMTGLLTAEDTTHYVGMNIPYSKFYETENVSGQVDVISTATTSKFRSTNGLANGTYNDGTNICGVTFPVAMDDAAYQALSGNKVGAGDIGTADSYNFYDLAEAPASYKTLTYDSNEQTYSFSDEKVATQDAAGLSVTELTTTGGFGNYQISLQGVSTDNLGTINGRSVTIYGAVISTNSGNYPMYMLQNIWLGTRVPNVELAWCVNDAPAIYAGHGSGSQISQYNMNGSKLTGVKLITDAGVYNISADLQLPVIDMTSTLKAEDANELDGSTTFTASLAADFNPEYTVNGTGCSVAASTAAGGTITIDPATAPGTYTLTATDKTGKYASVSTTFSVSAYAYVNIPYSYFYKDEISNSVDVDVVTSATKSKASMKNLAGNVYYSEDKSEIRGVTYPALLTSTTGLTAVSADAIATAGSWSYTLLTEKPNQFKSVTVKQTGGHGSSVSTNYTVSAVSASGVEVSASEVSASFKTSSSYGDYQLSFSGLFTETDRSGNVTKTGLISSDAVIYGAVISTSEGISYGLRGLENYFKGELAWCTGFTANVHGCPTSSAHYASMMGKTISSVTYLTTSGVYTVKGLSIYVPVKSSDIRVSVADAHVKDGKAVVSASFPTGYAPVYSVNMADAVISTDTAGAVINFPADAANGQYTLTVSDNNNKYAPTSVTFQVKADAIPAAYDSTKKALVKASGATDDAFAAYIQAISSVTVDGTSYAKNGFHGAAGTVIVKDDGSIDTSLDLFKTSKVYSLTIPVTGYDDFTFSVNLIRESSSDSSSAASANSANADGSKAETIEITLDSGSKATIEVVKSAEGRIASASATVEATGKTNAKGRVVNTVSGKEIEAIISAAGTSDVVLTLSVKNAAGKVAYEVKFDLSLTELLAKLTSSQAKLTADEGQTVSLAVIKQNKTTNQYVLSAYKSASYNTETGLTTSFPASSKYYYVITSRDKYQSLANKIYKNTSLKKAAVSISKGKTAAVALKNNNSAGSVKSVKYSSSNSRVARVSSSGKVTGLTAGSAVVKAKVTYYNGAVKTLKEKVTVK